jgi:predicted GNAT family N-acyltransferase
LDGKPVGTGRLRLKKSYAKFERIATLKNLRGAGIGRSLMDFMEAYALEKHPLYLRAMHAQAEAVGFYLKLDWVAIGEAFIEADIEHRVLIKPPPSKIEIQKLLLWKDPEVRDDIKDYLKSLMT